MPSPSQDSGDLARRLRSAGGAALAELVADHGRHFRLPEVRQTLLNPHVSAEVIADLGSHRHLLALYEVQVALARHRRTPEVLALRLMPSIRWRDLVEIALDARLRAPVRRLAEKTLQQRLPRLTLGEKIALGRRSPNDTAARLAGDPDLRVLAAVLENPRLTDQDLMSLLTGPSTTPRHLDLVARNERFGHRYDIRAALCRNPQTPYRVLFELLGGLRRDDLAAVAACTDHAGIVLRLAEDLLASNVGDDGLAPIHAIESVDLLG